MLWISVAAAGSWSTDFSDGSPGGLTGGEVSDGVLVIEDSATLTLPGLESFDGRIRLRLMEGERVEVTLGQTWTADYAGDVVTLGQTSAAFPAGHLDWIPYTRPTLEPAEDFWDGGNTLHCDVLEVDGTLYLYWTGEMASGYPYRQIGVATSTDGIAWEKHTGNPILTIDYDTTTVDGVHVHMPTVVEDDGAWTMLYSCYQNNVGNRLCRATSTDGLSWATQGVAIDLGPEGAFDSGSLRMPEMWIDGAGTYQVLYNGTDPEQHYGPTGWASSSDQGVTWEKQGAITDDEHFLQGGGVLRTAYGLEQWFNVDDRFEHAWADPEDPSVWTSTGAMMEKGELPSDWAAGYIQAPSMVEIGARHHMYFNAYGMNDAGEWHERIWHAESRAQAGAWMDLVLRWEGAELTLVWSDEGGMTAGAATPVWDADRLVIATDGRVEVDSVDLVWTHGEASDTGDSGRLDSDGNPWETVYDSGLTCPMGNETRRCGCSASPTGSTGLASLLVLGYIAAQRRREP